MRPLPQLDRSILTTSNVWKKKTINMSLLESLSIFYALVMVYCDLSRFSGFVRNVRGFLDLQSGRCEWAANRRVPSNLCFFTCKRIKYYSLVMRLLLGSIKKMDFQLPAWVNVGYDGSLICKTADFAIQESWGLSTIPNVSKWERDRAKLVQSPMTQLPM